MIDDGNHQPQFQIKWALIRDNWIPDWSITYRRRDSIQELVKGQPYDWKHFKKIGWKAIRVKVAISEFKKP
jgi:hypothetical protein